MKVQTSGLFIYQLDSNKRGLKKGEGIGKGSLAQLQVEGKKAQEQRLEAGD
jgi:hypothetical protein